MGLKIGDRVIHIKSGNRGTVTIIDVPNNKIYVKAEPRGMADYHRMNLVYEWKLDRVRLFLK